MDTTIEQLRYEEPSAKFCVEEFIDDNGVGFVDYFNFGRNTSHLHLQSLITPPFQVQLEEKKSLVPKINTTPFELHSLFSSNGTNFLQFVFLGHNVENKMEHKFEKISLHICTNYNFLFFPIHFVANL